MYLINDTLCKETLDEIATRNRPACLIIVIDGYDELFDDMKDSDEPGAGLSAVLAPDTSGRSTGFAQGHEQSLHRSGGGVTSLDAGGAL